MDDSTLEQLAEFICGDDEQSAPIYRTGSELTNFFSRAGIRNLEHDGSTRKWWTLSALSTLTSQDIEKIIKRLASPKEYRGDNDKVRKAIKSLNSILKLEGLQVNLFGMNVVIEKMEPDFNLGSEETDFKLLPPPDFCLLNLEPGIGEILQFRWEEAERCINAEAFLAGVVIMGSLLEGLMLGVMQKKQREASSSIKSPKDPKTGKTKSIHKWTLSEMIEVAHAEKWIDLDVKKFSHSLREFRNLVHPYSQLVLGAEPDEDTCKISWPVVQAAVNDLSVTLRKVS